MASLPNKRRKTQPTGDQIPSSIADVFTESREVLLTVIMDLREKNEELIHDMNMHQNLLDEIQNLKEEKDDQAKVITRLKEKLRRIYNESRTY